MLTKMGGGDTESAKRCYIKMLSIYCHGCVYGHFIVYTIAKQRNSCCMVIDRFVHYKPVMVAQ
jgi:hypothetical protein